MKRKLMVTLSVIFMVFMTVLFVIFLVKGDSSRWQLSLGGFAVSALPLFLLKLKNNPFNISMIIGYYLFIFCTIFLGSIASFYIRFHWWDTTIHFYKGIFVSCVGIILFKSLIPKQARKDVSRWIFFLFVLSLSATASVFWEIYEFLGDLTFTHTMQLGGNTDTMMDLIFGMAGALLATFYALLLKKDLE